MKDNSLDGHRGKVALSDTTRNAARNSTVGLKCELKTPPATSANDGTATTNFDDDYNEWELGIGDLIIDLDADIEKTNERNGNAAQQGIPSHQNHHPRPNDTATSPGSGSATAGNSSIVDSPNSASAATTFNFLGTQTSCNNNLAAAMSNSKSPRLAVNSAAASGTSGSAAGVGAVTTGSNGASTGAAGTFEHQATVDKGLKMKIKRKTVGSKYSEAKHEIVQSDTKSASHNSSENTNNVSNNSSSSASASNSPATNSDTPKSKHSSSKGRNSSHREKKEKNRDKDKNSSARSTSTTVPEVNGVSGGVLSPMKLANSDTNVSSPAPPSLCSNAVPSPVNNTSVASPSVPRSLPAAATTAASSPVSNSVPDVTQPPSVVSLSNQTVCASSSSPPMPNLTVKLEHKFTPSPSSQSCPVPSVVIKAEERPDSPPLKKIKLENADGSDEVERPGSPSPERKDTSTCTTSTSVGTITEPDCLGPCEPGTSVTLEGIVWQETEGGVLVVNVTWRGKTYVGTLLDCTKHDWAPPRFCESPTSDVDSKTGKGRGKRGRGGNNSSSEIASFTDTRNVVQSKLRNGKGRRTTINSNAANSGFTVPSSPAKNEATTNGGTKRKGRPNDTEASTPVDSKTSKRSRNQKQQQTPAAASPVPSASPAVSTEPPPSSQPSSPQWITCPEPNCSKRYKHINGLKYHKAHAHSSASDGTKMEDTATEDSSKDVTNSSDNEESMQESASVSTSPAPSFANAVPTAGKILLNESASSSSSSSVNGLPETDPYSLTTDLSTLASVAIGDSATSQKVANTSRIAPPTLHSSASQDISVVSSDGDSVGHSAALPVSVSNGSPNPAPLSDMLSSSLSTSEGAGLSVAVSAVTTSVIQSSNSLDNVASSQAVSMNIPTPHVNFSQGLLASNSSATNTFTTSTVVCNNSNSLSPSISHLSTNVTTTFAAISSITSTSIASPTTPLPMIDKSKIKQEKPDKYKPKSPLGTSPIRPIIPAPTPLIALSTNMPGTHPGMNIGSHCVGASLKPIQPKPTILGEPSTVNPSLEALKKDKSKHKKKSKDKERGDKKIPTLPLTPTKLGMNPGEDCEALELTSYPSLEAVSGPIPTSHPILSPLISQSKPPETSMDLSLPEDTMNDNVQSPAYSDISDANDTAPVLESEVPSGKEKEDKVGKSTPDASQSPATNISAYGMYPYYSQPPYLLPSVSPQAAASQGPNIMDKNEMNKKSDSERVKERPWSNPSGDIRERQHLEHHEMEKKQSREDSVQGPNPMASGPGSGVPVQEYPMSQHYPYPYGYVQGYPYPVDSSSYHMHMLESDPHYKQQYKQYLDEHHRMYKEQQHHQQQQQLQQHMQQAAAHQQQQQQQQQVHHGHHQSSHHQGHHQSSKSHHSVIKEERDRSRDSKDRSANLDKMSNSGLMNEHSSKIQHSSNPMVSSKDQDVREVDMRPPSLPAQARIESSASSVALKEKQNENHQILKENIELKSQMEDSKTKINQYEMAMIYERHKEDMRRFYMCQDRMIEQQQQKMEPGIHHHTHHHQTIQSHSQHHASSYSNSSMKSHKDDLSGSVHSKSNHYGDSTRSSVVSPAKSDHIKNLHSTSSPKGGPRDSRDPSMGGPKEYMNSSGRESSSSSSKKESGGGSKNSDSSDKKGAVDKKPEVKVESEGQKPTMETTGPPPPPTNSYAYLHPSYLQPAPPHFAHMPFEPPHAAMYRGGPINPMIVSTPHYPNSPYMHPQIRYVTPGPCDLPVHPPPEAMAGKLHPGAGPPKALDLLHQVSQQYTTTHKIHELSEHAVMSPTPVSSAPSAATTPSNTASSGSSKTSASEPAVVASKGDSGSSRDASRSPPTQRHLHTHHHTHVGVGYPIYDPYGGIITPGPTPTVECKPIHPLQVKPSAPSTAGPRFGWP
ncbi:hypothetical protein JTE90_029346 [Oedothorax gibbosus]|uniref:C2H2-type domain-containing protein n=1 Tax=Oedothorax gibbosus TaxID=931172 RepID=A0AAV6UEL7_9ARAC|nr:hypothetical protein JTE90_029346 [Oedothorax gibbosus]